MGYIERILGDNERVMYQTHQHAVVLLERVAGALFAFLVFLGVAIAVLASPSDEVRFIVGLIVLGSLILPLIMFLRARGGTREGESAAARVWRPIVLGVAILAVALVLMFRPDLEIVGVLAIIVALLPLAWLVRGFLDWQNERYMITNRRVLEIKGIVNKLVRDSALEKVNDVEMRQSVMGRLLGYGTVQIITGSDIGVNMFRRISNPVRFKREMLNAKEQLHGGPLADEVSTFAPAPAAGPSAAPRPADTVADRLAELNDLYQKGFITDEEFQLKRKELLDQI